jgi:hypothetical protein
MSQDIETLIVQVDDPFNIPDVALRLEKLGYKVESFTGLLSNITVVASEKDTDDLKNVEGVVDVRLNTAVRDLFGLSNELRSYMSKE